MMLIAFRYVFSDAIPLVEIETILLRTLLTAEYLDGPASVRLDAGHYLDDGENVCLVDAATPVGSDVNKLFVGLLDTAFGPDTFTVERLCLLAGES